MDKYANDDYVLQMRDLRMVSRNVADYYIKITPYLAAAIQYSFRSPNDDKKKQQENFNRVKAVNYFTTLILMTYQLPKVQEELEKVERFKSATELISKVNNTDRNGIKSVELGEIFLDYSKVLVQAGLINAFDMRESNWSRLFKK